MNAITGDEVFTRFRRKLEDAVTVAINSGKRVRRVRGFSCPLGTAMRGVFDRPWPKPAASAWNIAPGDAADFAGGFDGDPTAYIEDGGNGSGPYYELGKLYRARFP